MTNVLFVTWDGGGNVPPAVGIATELQARGHAVRMLGHARQRPSLEGSGLEVEPAHQARSFSALDANSPLALVATFGDRGLGHDVLDALESWALPAPAEQAQIVLPWLGGDSVIIGAAELAFTDLLHDPVELLAGADAALVDSPAE